VGGSATLTIGLISPIATAVLTALANDMEFELG
jgi:hypothetical protein